VWIILGLIFGERGCIGSWWGNRRERDYWGDLGVDGCIILEWVCVGRAEYRFLVGKPEGKGSLGRPRPRCVDNVMVGLWGEGVYSVFVGKPEGK